MWYIFHLYVFCNNKLNKYILILCKIETFWNVTYVKDIIQKNICCIRNSVKLAPSEIDPGGGHARGQARGLTAPCCRGGSRVVQPSWTRALGLLRSLQAPGGEGSGNPPKSRFPSELQEAVLVHGRVRSSLLSDAIFSSKRRLEAGQPLSWRPGTPMRKVRSLCAFVLGK